MININKYKENQIKEYYQERENWEIIDNEEEQINNNNQEREYWDEMNKMTFEILEKGKIKVYKNNKFYTELYDHSDEIVDIFYNPRLNMYATSSKDGFACLYILPYKLFKVIKNENSYFNQIFLSANPFPSFIAYDKLNDDLYSYTINGLLIKVIHLKEENEYYTSNCEIKTYFNMHGGTTKDKIIIKFIDIMENICYKTKILNVPLFDE